MMNRCSCWQTSEASKTFHLEPICAHVFLWTAASYGEYLICYPACSLRSQIPHDWFQSHHTLQGLGLFCCSEDTKALDKGVISLLAQSVFCVFWISCLIFNLQMTFEDHSAGFFFSSWAPSQLVSCPTGNTTLSIFQKISCSVLYNSKTKKKKLKHFYVSYITEDFRPLIQFLVTFTCDGAHFIRCS